VHEALRTAATATDLARILSGQNKADAAMAVLAKIEELPGTSAELAAGWTLRCDLFTKKNDIIAARQCLRQLMTSGLIDGNAAAQTSAKLEALRLAPVVSSPVPVPAPVPAP
jgi:predicted negative regulator of RcsB-dependent stress response